MTITIDGTEVLCSNDFTINQEMLNTPSVILNNVYPKSWETDKDYVTRFYHPADYSQCLIKEITSLLPSNYTQVEYIQSSGTQYIDTGYLAKGDLKVVTDIEYTSTISGNQFIYGGRNTSTSKVNALLVSNNGSRFRNDYNTSNTNATPNISNLVTKWHIEKDKGALTITSSDGQTITKNITNSNFVSDYNVWIFTVNNAGNTLNLASYKLYSFKMYDNDVLKRDFIPCYRNSDNEVGLYDIVNNEFYTNKGTGTFNKGSDVPSQEQLLFSGVVKNSGDISLNPRYPHYSTLQILDYKTFLSEGETLDFVIANKTILEAIQEIISVISPYGFELGNVSILDDSEIIGAYSTKDKTAYDVFNYIADITQSRWTTRVLGVGRVAIDFYDPTLMTQGTQIDYTNTWFTNNKIIDMSYNYGTWDYRNKQVMTSQEVYGDISQIQTIYYDGYTNQLMIEYPIGRIQKITVNGIERSFASNDEKNLGINADFYYSIGNNYFEKDMTINAGSLITITYIPIVEGRQIVLNSTEVSRVTTAAGVKGVVARYENRNDATTSSELQKIGQSYIKYKGVPEIRLTIKSQSNIWEIGQRVQFNAPIGDLSDEYMVKRKEINYIVTADTIFYTYELTSSFNSESAINYFDNQRAKANGNIKEGEYISRNVDLENSAKIIFYDTESEIVSVVNNSDLQADLEMFLGV